MEGDPIVQGEEGKPGTRSGPTSPQSGALWRPHACLMVPELLPFWGIMTLLRGPHLWFPRQAFWLHLLLPTEGAGPDPSWLCGPPLQHKVSRSERLWRGGFPSVEGSAEQRGTIAPGQLTIQALKKLFVSTVTTELLGVLASEPRLPCSLNEMRRNQCLAVGSAPD